MNAMTVADDFYQAAEVVCGTGEHADWPEVDLPYLEWVEALWEAERQKALWASVVSELKGQLASRLEGHSIHDGEWLYRTVRKRARFLHDKHMLLDWLGNDREALISVLKLDGPDPIRITQLRAVAESRGQDPAVVEDTLLFFELGEPQLEKVRLDSERCPQWVKGREAGRLL